MCIRDRNNTVTARRTRRRRPSSLAILSDSLHSVLNGGGWCGPQEPSCSSSHSLRLGRSLGGQSPRSWSGSWTPGARSPSGGTCFVGSCGGAPADALSCPAVSYTHLTLPTILRVYISVVAV